MKSLYLRFAAPYQSWAGARVTGNHVQTQPIPTRSALIGMSAAALGARRGEWPQWLQELEMEVRVDNRGRPEKDFQTINPRPEAQSFIERIWTASGQKGKAPASFTPDAGKGTSIVLRSYLAGAEFTTKLSHDRADELAAGFAGPGFSPYLGRKAFAPTFPFVLGIGAGDLLDEAPARTPGTANIHVLDERDNAFPDRSVTVAAMPLAERLHWWATRAVIPARERG